MYGSMQRMMAYENLALVTAKTVTFADRLHQSIAKIDVAGARAVMDDVFWQRADMKPDWFHLYHALGTNDRKLVRLLTTWGASFNAEEAKVAAKLMGHKWDDAKALLRGTGIPLGFSEDDLNNVHPALLVRMARHAGAALKSAGLGGTDTLEQTLSAAMTKGFTAAVLSNDLVMAKNILTVGGIDLGQPVDIDAAFEHAASKSDHDAMTFLTRVTDGQNGLGLAIKPLQISSIGRHLDLTLAVHKTGYLDPVQPSRMELLAAWALCPPDGEYLQNRAAIKKLGQFLFAHENPLRAAQIDEYMLLVQSTHSAVQNNISDMEQDLTEIGFFDNPLWTAAHLRALSGRGSTPMRDAFNKLAVRKAFQEEPVTVYLSRGHIAEIDAALTSKSFSPNEVETLEIVDFLHKSVKNSGMTKYASDMLVKLRDAGADFSRVDPMDFLGKKDPEIAKALLDAGIAEPQHFDLEKILAKTSNRLQLVTAPGDKGYAYTEFACQLMLENLYPHRYKPLRGVEGGVYQKTFVEDLVHKNQRNITVEFKPKISPEDKKKKKPGTNSTGPS